MEQKGNQPSDSKAVKDDSGESLTSWYVILLSLLVQNIGIQGIFVLNMLFCSNTLSTATKTWGWKPVIVTIHFFPISLLSQYRLCAAGIGLGTAYSLRYKKGLIPMIAAGAIGTTADMVYGYLVECSQYVDGNVAVEPKNDPSSKGAGTAKTPPPPAKH
jgi:hypothetical protein